MLTTIQQTVEIKKGGILQLHVSKVKPHTKVSIVAVMDVPDDSIMPQNASDTIKRTAGLLKGKMGDPVKMQRKLRGEWATRLTKENGI